MSKSKKRRLVAAHREKSRQRLIRPSLPIASECPCRPLSADFARAATLFTAAFMLATCLIAVRTTITRVSMYETGMLGAPSVRCTVTEGDHRQTHKQDAENGWLDHRRLRFAAGRKKGGMRSKAEIEREQREILARVEREVDDIVAAFHARLPRTKAKRIGAVYARYSSRFQSSIPDQVRTLLEVALREGTFVPRELIFFDLAVRGYRDSRPGLDALRAALAAKKLQVLLVFGTSRLFRKAHRAVRFVEEEIVEKKMRCFFVQQNIDTAANKDWRLHLMIQAAVDENGTSMYAANIRAAQQGMFLRMEVHGTLALGYFGVPIEGAPLTRRGRIKRRIAIDPDTSPWVERIYGWYVIDGVPMNVIAQRLNEEPEAPSPPKSPHGIWTQQSVRGILANPRFRGYWEYGVTQAIYQSVADYVRQEKRDEPLQGTFFEDLRIISDDLWYRAQALLLKERGDPGRKATKSGPKGRPKVLNGIFRCPVHNRPLQTGGSGNRAMICKLCRSTQRDVRPLYSQLDRALALQLTLEKLAELLRGDQVFVSFVVEAFRREAQAGQQPDPGLIERLKAQVAKKTQTIQANLRNRGETEADQREADDLIRELRAERTKINEQLAGMEAARQRRVAIPTEQELRELIESLGTVLTSAASGEVPEDPRAVRQLIHSLTEGKIDLYQQGERRPKRGWLQGRFRVRLLPYLWERLTGEAAIGFDEETDGVEVTIDYLPPPQENKDLEKAWELKLAEALNVEIAEKLKCGKGKVTALLKEAAVLYGVPYEDGRSRRSRLARKQRKPPAWEKILPEVGRRIEAGKLIVEISEELGVERNALTKVYNKYRADQGLPPLDGRSRRKTLERKSRPRKPPEP